MSMSLPEQKPRSKFDGLLGVLLEGRRRFDA